MDQYYGLHHQELSEGLTRSNEYDFISEVAPGIWKVYLKKDRVDFVARDVTDELESPTGHKSQVLFLLDPKTHNIGGPIMAVLNHENLVNFVDWVQAFHSSTVKLGFGGRNRPRPRHFIIWDFCDAGTLENMMMPRIRPALTVKQKEERQRRVQEAESAGQKYEPPLEPKIFMPETLCWHVLCSILKALAWLHHGVRDQYDPISQTYEQHRVDVDWQTILHRDIKPSNIFFCHPRDKETYGLCKLGNFSKAFISGHVNGILGDRVPSSVGKVLAGREGHMPLQKLRVLDVQIKNYHPPMKDQPYTILSEYRALGDVILAMMVEPVERANTHVAEVRNRDFWNTLYSNDYSLELKNQVYELLSTEDMDDMCTSKLYQRAKQAFRRFILYDPEGKEMVLVEHVLSMQTFKDEMEREHNLMLTDLSSQILEEQDAKFGEKPMVERKDLLTEIDAVVDILNLKYR